MRVNRERFLGLKARVSTQGVNMRMDSLGRVEFLLKEIQKAERTEKELWDFIEHENAASQATIIGEGVALDHTPLKPAGDAA